MQITRSSLPTARGPADWFTGAVFIDTVTEGVGRCRRRGGPLETIRPGDRVFFAPDEDHWHGAAPDRFMVHTAMQQVDDNGSPVTWGDHVTDAEYDEQ